MLDSGGKTGLKHRESKPLIKEINLNDLRQVQQLLALQVASYTVEAELISFYDIPPLKDTIATLQASDETFYGYFTEDERLAGAISFKRDGEVLDIYRMAVSPTFFRQGIAGRLLQFVEKVEEGITRIIVSTGTKNYPAVALYRRYGFHEVEQRAIAPGVFVTHFAKDLKVKPINKEEFLRDEKSLE